MGRLSEFIRGNGIIVEYKNVVGRICVGEEGQTCTSQLPLNAIVKERADY